MFSDDVELCGQHIRLIRHRDGPDVNSKPHLKPSTGLGCAEELVRECRGGEEGKELFTRAAEVFPLFLFESCFSSDTTKVERG